VRLGSRDQHRDATPNAYIKPSPLITRHVKQAFTAWRVLAALSLVVGCERGDSRTSRSRTDCFEGSATQVPAFSVRASGPRDVGLLSGVSVHRNFVLSLDLQDGRVRVFDVAQNREHRAFGRTGNGPGEFQSFAAAQSLRTFPSLWIDVRGDTVFTYDGRRIDAWLDGVLAQSRLLAVQSGTAFARVSSLRALNRRLLLGVEYSPSLRSAADAPGKLELFNVSSSDSAKAAALEFTTLPWPRNDAGGLARGLAEAKPSWDALGECAVFSDGHSSKLIVASLESGHRDTLTLSLPERFAEVVPEERYERLGVRRNVSPPKFPARVQAITLDHTGTVWLLPARPAYDGEIWKVNLGTGTFWSDTSRVFPLRFTADGIGIGLSVDDDGLSQVHLFTHRSVPNRPQSEE